MSARLVCVPPRVRAALKRKAPVGETRVRATPTLHRGTGPFVSTGRQKHAGLSTPSCERRASPTPPHNRPNSMHASPHSQAILRFFIGQPMAALPYLALAPQGHPHHNPPGLPQLRTIRRPRPASATCDRLRSRTGRIVEGRGLRQRLFSRSSFHRPVCHVSEPAHLPFSGGARNRPNSRTVGWPRDLRIRRRTRAAVTSSNRSSFL